jgi:diacylglycerol kinase (ATP)
MEAALIRNPASGRGSGMKAWPTIESKLREILPDLRIEETTAPGSARLQAARLAAEGCQTVIAAGGDGTICDVMQGVLGTQAALAVLPMGTGNDFARTLGFGPNIDKAIEVIANGKRERVDVGRWQIGDRHGHFINIAGCGFDGAVAERVNRGFRSLRGTSAYLAAVLQTLMTYEATTLRIIVDGERIECRAMLCAIANAKSYGGGMLVAPQADLQDGLLDLVLVRELGKVAFLLNFPKVLKGKHLSHPSVTHLTFKNLEMQSDPPLPFLVDGELLPTGRVNIEVQPSALEVVMPART